MLLKLRRWGFKIGNKTKTDEYGTHSILFHSNSMRVRPVKSGAHLPEFSLVKISFVDFINLKLVFSLLIQFELTHQPLSPFQCIHEHFALHLPLQCINIWFISLSSSDLFQIVYSSSAQNLFDCSFTDLHILGQLKFVHKGLTSLSWVLRALF